jgi:hypothetical protein|tara:strand:+ start:415 stop:582 length:168 start_codon:yes stop_codon:yes gene_type:complete
MYKKVISQMSGQFSCIEKTVSGQNPIYIPLDPANTDYAEYLLWEAIDGNTIADAD